MGTSGCSQGRAEPSGGGAGTRWPTIAGDAAPWRFPKIQLVVALMMVPAVLLLVLGVLLIELSRQVGGVIGGG